VLLLLQEFQNSKVNYLKRELGDGSPVGGGAGPRSQKNMANRKCRRSSTTKFSLSDRNCCLNQKAAKMPGGFLHAKKTVEISFDFY